MLKTPVTASAVTIKPSPEGPSAFGTTIVQSNVIVQVTSWPAASAVKFRPTDGAASLRRRGRGGGAGRAGTGLGTATGTGTAAGRATRRSLRRRAPSARPRSEPITNATRYRKNPWSL